ncbi:MAG TPA: amino acid ABC transporter substrate-binding protein, partial [Thermoleophilia bacterium]|nr:amino acid ABC transporter substrate-binding protein [Thermoleophilia bacterium]
RFMNRPQSYDAHGLLIPASFTVKHPAATANACLDVARWQDSAFSGAGGWVTQVPDMDTNCFTVPVISYAP